MNQALKEGLIDAVGFVVGALIGMFAGKLLGLDVFATGYGASSLFGIALCGIGGGLGLQLARRTLGTPKK
jgi:hypothetical protein